MISGLCRAPPALDLKFSTRFRVCVVDAVAAVLEDARVGEVLARLTGVKPLEVGPMEAARRGGVENSGLGESVVM